MVQIWRFTNGFTHDLTLQPRGRNFQVFFTGLSRMQNFSPLSSFYRRRRKYVHTVFDSVTFIRRTFVFTIFLAIYILKFLALFQINFTLHKYAGLDLCPLPYLVEGTFLFTLFVFWVLLSWLVILLIYKPLSPSGIVEGVFCLNFVLVRALKL